MSISRRLIMSSGPGAKIDNVVYFEDGDNIGSAMIFADFDLGVDGHSYLLLGYTIGASEPVTAVRLDDLNKYVFIKEYNTNAPNTNHWTPEAITVSPESGITIAVSNIEDLAQYGAEDGIIFFDTDPVGLNISNVTQSYLEFNDNIDLIGLQYVNGARYAGFRFEYNAVYTITNLTLANSFEVDPVAFYYNDTDLLYSWVNNFPPVSAGASGVYTVVSASVDGRVFGIKSNGNTLPILVSDQQGFFGVISGNIVYRPTSNTMCYSGAMSSRQEYELFVGITTVGTTSEVLTIVLSKISATSKLYNKRIFISPDENTMYIGFTSNDGYYGIASISTTGALNWVSQFTGGTVKDIELTDDGTEIVIGFYVDTKLGVVRVKTDNTITGSLGYGVYYRDATSLFSITHFATNFSSIKSLYTGTTGRAHTPSATTSVSTADVNSSRILTNSLPSDYVYVPILNNMLSNLDGASSSLNTSSSAFEAFDGDPFTAWVTTINESTGWLQRDFGATTTVLGYHITSNGTTDAPHTWTIYVSDTGAFAGEEILVDTVDLAGVNVNGTVSFTVSTPTPGRYIRINAIADDECRIEELLYKN